VLDFGVSTMCDNVSSWLSVNIGSAYVVSSPGASSDIVGSIGSRLTSSLDSSSNTLNSRPSGLTLGLNGIGEAMVNDSGLVGLELSSSRSTRSKMELFLSKYDLGELAILDKYVELVAIDCMDHRLSFACGMFSGTAGLVTYRCGLITGVERPDVDGLEVKAEGISAFRLGVARGVFRIGNFSFFAPSLVW